MQSKDSLAKEKKDQQVAAALDFFGDAPSSSLGNDEGSSKTSLARDTDKKRLGKRKRGVNSLSGDVESALSSDSEDDEVESVASEGNGETSNEGDASEEEGEEEG